MESHGLLATFVAALTLAFILGFTARRLKLSPIVGYLLAGVVVGPFTPGYVGDINVAQQFAEIGVILLMFGVGLKFSLPDLWSVRNVALPGALVQMTAATGLGAGVGVLLGMPLIEGVMLGFSLSVASTVVMLRELEERSLLNSKGGRICLGWLVVEDIFIVLAIVLVPSLASLTNGDGGSMNDPLFAVGVAAGKVVLFVALMLFVGTRVFPWLIVRVAHVRSRELLSLGTLTLALGVAFIAFELFGASFALGAFLAGVSLNGTKLTKRVAEDSQPLRDTFAVLFFVSVGMLFDPGILLRAPVIVVAVVAIIVLGKSLAALAIAALYRLPWKTSLLIAVALAQIGEFSFVLAGLGLTYNLIGEDTHNAILAGALLSIAINPVLFLLFAPKAEEEPAFDPAAQPKV